MTPFRQLKYAVAVADFGGVQAASEKISISQPALTNAIQKIEQDYGIKIFLRDRPNKLKLTSVGRRFIANAKRLIENAEEPEISLESEIEVLLEKAEEPEIEIESQPKKETPLFIRPRRTL